MLVKRNRIEMFFLMGILEGLYHIFWTIRTQNETNEELIKQGLEIKKLDKLSGWMVVLLSFLTLGIFGIVWQIYMCKKLVRLGGVDQTVPVVVLLCLMFGIIFNPLIIQGAINDIIKNSGLKNTMQFS